MEEKVDLRIVKTRKALFDTFLEFLQQEGFDSITVNALCEKAMVRRATFYKHFADKYDFFAAFVRHISEGFYAKSLTRMQEERVVDAGVADAGMADAKAVDAEAGQAGEAGAKTGETLAPPLEYCYLMSVHFFEFLHQHEKIIGNVMESGAFSVLLDILTEEMYRSFFLEFMEYIKAGNPMRVSPETACSFIVGGLVQICKKWATAPSWEDVDGLLGDIRILLNSMDLFTFS